LKKHVGMIGLGTLLFLLLGGWMAGAQPAANQQSDLPTVWDLSEKVMIGDKKLLIKEGNFYRTYADRDGFERVVVELSRKLNFPAQQIGMHEDHPVYESNVQQPDGAKVSLTVLGNDDREMYVVLSRESIGDETIDRAKAWQNKMEEPLRTVGIVPDWNIVVQGMLRNSGNTENAAEEFFRVVQKETGAKELENYKDINTFSVTYYTSKLQTFVKSGDHRVNLQAAIHLETESSEWRATLGTPLITTEY